MSETRPNGLPHTMAFPQFSKPESSWWLAQSTRSEFMEAHKREVARMTQATVYTPGERRTVDTHYGRV